MTTFKEEIEWASNYLEEAYKILKDLPYEYRKMKRVKTAENEARRAMNNLRNFNELYDLFAPVSGAPFVDYMVTRMNELGQATSVQMMLGDDEQE